MLRASVSRALALCVVSAIGACAPTPEGSQAPEPLPPLETEDIGGALDAELSTEDDRRGPRWVESQGGPVPNPQDEGPVPAGFPQIAGAVVVDSGTDADGNQVVELESSEPVGRVESRLLERLTEMEWTTTQRAQHRLVAVRGGQSVEIWVRPLDSGASRIRLSYQ